MLKRIDGSWFLGKVFVMRSDVIASPEVIVKVPKPSQFEDFIFQEIIPAPEVFLEEGSYYVLTWKSSVFTVGNITETLIRVRYSSDFSYIKFAVGLVPTFTGVVCGFLLVTKLVFQYRLKIGKDYPTDR